jgi:hypothetical protein
MHSADDDREASLTRRRIRNWLISASASAWVSGSAFGVRCSAFGVRRSAFGVRRSAFGVRCSAFGVRCSVFGVRRSVLGVRRSAGGIRRSAFGIRRSAFGVRWPPAESRLPRAAAASGLPRSAAASASRPPRAATEIRSPRSARRNTCLPSGAHGWPSRGPQPRREQRPTAPSREARSARNAHLRLPPPSSAGPPCARPRTTTCRPPPRPGDAHTGRGERRSSEHALRRGRPSRVLARIGRDGRSPAAEVVGRGRSFPMNESWRRTCLLRTPSRWT